MSFVQTLELEVCWYGGDPGAYKWEGRVQERQNVLTGFIHVYYKITS